MAMMQRSVSERPLHGLRVLVVEDDYFIAIEMCNALREAGADVIGPARDLEAGLAAIRREQIDCGVLDINLRGRMAFQLATELRARKIPAIFATGYDASMIPAELADVARLEKPVDLVALRRAIEAACL
jgi:DNA-binding response OmpR family regulator